MPDAPLLEFCNVNLQYESVWALRNICLSLKPGETRMILGAAGSGKTTLLKAVLGLVAVDEGDIKLFGDDVRSMSETQLFALRSRAGMVFQEGGLFDSLSVGENVGYPLLNRQTTNKNGNLTDAEVESRVRDALRFVELERAYDKFPSEISGGMRRRVGIARAVVTEPPLVLYDSPTAGLDPITANTIMALIAKERDVRNSASLIVTYRFQDGELMAGFYYDREQKELIPVGEEDPVRKKRTKFIVMKEGEVVFFGSLQELEASNDPYVKRFVKHEE
ncbi:MAG: ATP-binding cassette domain-containing protein [Acidobacteriaceae bacterium]|nr:ATP-binding cassette domain-containing protein [Acidobacteriaceae bacterium]MBV9503159.1 ATP-binding cassette domain-containing protein [Acidobacteriaceae bacterium]